MKDIPRDGSRRSMSCSRRRPEFTLAVYADNFDGLASDVFYHLEGDPFVHESHKAGVVCCNWEKRRRVSEQARGWWPGNGGILVRSHGQRACQEVQPRGQKEEKTEGEEVRIRDGSLKTWCRML